MVILHAPKNRIPYKWNPKASQGSALTPGIEEAVPERAPLYPPPLAESDGGARSFAGDTEGCCEGGAWRVPRPRAAAV